ncbi:hypothetical protein C8J57DRAFT_1503638 [Mycena rebaudengoi]|nr:hypothetical protein C8J57DRAFT_1503638 [Mycena rebaudengoi]
MKDNAIERAKVYICLKRTKARVACGQCPPKYLCPFHLRVYYLSASPASPLDPFTRRCNTTALLYQCTPLCLARRSRPNPALPTQVVKNTPPLTRRSRHLIPPSSSPTAHPPSFFSVHRCIHRHPPCPPAPCRLPLNLTHRLGGGKQVAEGGPAVPRHMSPPPSMLTHLSMPTDHLDDELNWEDHWDDEERAVANPYVDDRAMDVDEHEPEDEYEDDPDSSEAQARAFDLQHFPVDSISRTQDRRLQSRRSFAPLYIPDPQPQYPPHQEAPQPQHPPREEEQDWLSILTRPPPQSQLLFPDHERDAPPDWQTLCARLLPPPSSQRSNHPFSLFPDHERDAPPDWQTLSARWLPPPSLQDHNPVFSFGEPAGPSRQSWNTPLFLPASRDSTPPRRETPVAPHDERPHKRPKHHHPAVRFIDIEAAEDDAEDDEGDIPIATDADFIDGVADNNVQVPDAPPLGSRRPLISLTPDEDEVKQAELAAAYYMARSRDTTAPRTEGNSLPWARIKRGDYKGRLALVTVPNEEFLLVALPHKEQVALLQKRGMSDVDVQKALQQRQVACDCSLVLVNLKAKLKQKKGSVMSDLLQTSNIAASADEMVGFDVPHPSIKAMWALYNPVQWARVKRGTYRARLALITVPNDKYYVVPLSDEEQVRLLQKRRLSPDQVSQKLEARKATYNLGLVRVDMKKKIRKGRVMSDYLQTTAVNRTAEELAGFNVGHPKIEAMWLHEPAMPCNITQHVFVKGGQHAGKTGYIVAFGRYDNTSSHLHDTLCALVLPEFAQCEDFIINPLARPSDIAVLEMSFKNGLVVPTSLIAHHILAIPYQLKPGDYVATVGGAWEGQVCCVEDVQPVPYDPFLGLPGNMALGELFHTNVPRVRVRNIENDLEDDAEKEAKEDEEKRNATEAAAVVVYTPKKAKEDQKKRRAAAAATAENAPKLVSIVPLGQLVLEVRLGDHVRITKSDSTIRRAAIQDNHEGVRIVPELQLADRVGFVVDGRLCGSTVVLEMQDQDNPTFLYVRGALLQREPRPEFDIQALLPTQSQLPLPARKNAFKLIRGVLKPDFPHARWTSMVQLKPKTGAPSGQEYVGRCIQALTKGPQQNARGIVVSQGIRQNADGGTTVLLNVKFENSQMVQEVPLDLQNIVEVRRGLMRVDIQTILNLGVNHGKVYEGFNVQVSGDHPEKTHQGMVIGEHNELKPDGTTNIVLTLRLGNNCCVDIPLEHAFHYESCLSLEEAVKVPHARWEPHYLGRLRAQVWMRKADPGSQIRDCEGNDLISEYPASQEKQVKAEGKYGFLVIQVNSDLTPENVNKKLVKPMLDQNPIREYTLPLSCVKPMRTSYVHGRENTDCISKYGWRVVIIGPDVAGGQLYMGEYGFIVVEPAASAIDSSGPSAFSVSRSNAVTVVKVQFQKYGDLEDNPIESYPLTSLCCAMNVPTYSINATEVSNF